MKKTLLEKHLERHPDFISKIEQFSEANKAKFLRGFKKEKDQTNFFSRVSELKFAEFLVRESINFEYEPTIEDKTPDFKIHLPNNRPVFFDVKRFNISDSDKLNHNKLYDLAKGLKTIQKSYTVLITQTKRELNFDLDLTINSIEKWILHNTLKKGDVFNYENKFNVVITKTDGNTDHLICFLNPENPKINQKKSADDILTKLKAYQEVIIANGYPFFVGIDLTYKTLKDPNDYWVEFLGGSCFHTESNLESFKLGKFYNQSEFDGLTGLLIRYNNQFYWLNNPRNSNHVNFKTTSFVD